MFRQGDKERELGQPISPLMDRAKGGVTKSQTGFFKIVALPQFTVCEIAFRALLTCQLEGLQTIISFRQSCCRALLSHSLQSRV